MDRTVAFGNVVVNGLRTFVDQNLAAGVNGTDADAADANAWQEELMGIIELVGGLVGSAANLKQAAAAIQKYVAGNSPFSNMVVLGSPNGQTYASVWTAPAGVYWVRYRLVGGGGGGGACPPGTTGGGGGGGGGGYAEDTVQVTPGTPYPYIIGASAQPGFPNGTAAQQGGTTSFGFGAATGGFGGANAFTAAFGGSPGVGMGGRLSLPGSWGTDGQAGNNVYPGNGGASMLGGGARGGVSQGEDASGSPGGGGGGGYLTASNGNGRGGVGGPGLLILEF